VDPNVARPVTARAPAALPCYCPARPVRSGVKDPCMPHEGPRLVEWTDHAFVKAEMLGVTRTDVERIVLEGHARRMHNTRAGKRGQANGGLQPSASRRRIDRPGGDPLAPPLTFSER